MIRLHEKCIFCYAQLPHPNQRKGEGEHVIPKNILGIWRSADVCEECKQHFGKNIDPIPMYNSPIIDAVHALDLSSKENFTEKIKYIGNDTHTGAKVKMFKKKGQVRINVTGNESIIDVPDENVLNVGLPRIKEYYKDRYDSELVERELLKLYQEYQTAEDNSLISSDKIPLTLRKGNISKIEVDKESLKDMSPLIAKIAVFFLNYTYTLEGLKRISNFQTIVDHARYDKPFPEGMIEFAPIRKDKTYHKRHYLQLRNFGKMGILNISLLGYPNWRVFLHYTEDVILYDEKGNELDMYGFAFDYEDKTQYHARRLKCVEKTEYITVDF